MCGPPCILTDLKRLLTVCGVVFIFTLAYIKPASAIWPFGDDEIEYESKIEGVESDLAQQLKLLEVASQAIDAENPPLDLAQLRANSLLMAERMRSLLVSEGYFEATVTALVQEASSQGSGSEEKSELPILLFRVNTNTLYKVADSNLRWGDSPPLIAENDTQFKLETGQAVKSKAILENSDNLKEKLAQERCFLSLDIKPKAILDTVTHIAEIRHEISYSPEANFGQTIFQGNSSIDEELLLKLIRWKQGECFNVRTVEVTQSKMLQTQLLANVLISYPKVPNAQGEVPMTVTVKDRAHRTVTAGTKFAFDEGFGVKAGWEHRNLFGKMHKLHIDAQLSQLESGINANYTLPYFFHDKQKLRLLASAKRENTDSFNSDNLSALAEIQRQLTSELSVGLGGGARFSRITELEEASENFGLVFFTGNAQYDSRDDTLDPKKGILGRASFTPYYDVTGQGIGFVRSELAGSTYFTANHFPLSPTLALRAAYGQINGASAADIPADLRYYAGGGGSVRGYNFRAIGPRDNGEAAGGTVWTELSTEVRLRFSEEFGGVAFVDAGTTYADSVVNPNEKLFLSAGLGARYFSPIGPVRFDVGIPLDEVEDDAPFGVYVSIGQAF